MRLNLNFGGVKRCDEGDTGVRMICENIIVCLYDLEIQEMTIDDYDECVMLLSHSCINKLYVYRQSKNAIL